jgi:nucleoside-diphosphate-sugar epimerase
MINLTCGVGKMTNTVIFGVGYIGRALLESWKKEGKRELTITTTSIDKLQSFKKEGDHVILARGDDHDAVLKALNSAEDVVIAIAPNKGSSYKNTYLETAKTFSAILAQNNSVKHLIYLSSTSVYGDRNGEWVSEESDLNPISENSKTLCDTEAIYLQQASADRMVTILRLGGIYGPGRTHFSRVKRLVEAPLPGNGNAFCNWVHQEDVVRAIDWILKHHLSGVYNICSDDHPSKKEFYTSIATEMNAPPIRWDPTMTGTHSGNRKVSNEKIRKKGFTFLHGCLGPL